MELWRILGLVLSAIVLSGTAIYVVWNAKNDPSW